MESVHRVKLYRLDSEGNWIDRGTGHISVAYLEQSEALGLIVLSEEQDQKTLLVHKLSTEDIYQRQGEATIISWTDKELGTEVAVSFEKQAGCDQVWEQIKQAQAAAVERDEYEEMQLPVPEIGNLEDLAKAIVGATPQQRDRLAASMLRPGWITTLLDVFKQCEDLEDVGSLNMVFRIVRAAIMVNDAALLEELLKEEYVMDVVGALEQDPDLPAPQKHREFLSTSVVFKEVVPIKDPALLAKIHQTYRIQYIKDVILPRSLDDATYATLSSLALFNNVEVVSALAGDPEFLHQLFVALDRADPGGEEWADLVAFLQEFCNLARHLQQQARQQLFSKLVQLGLFEQVTRIMKVGNDTTKLRATDVLLSVMQHDTHALRTFLQQQKDHMLFSLLVREFTDGSGEGGLCEQVAELLKLLLDPDSLKEKPEKSEFVDLFYGKFMDRLLDVILQDKQINPKEGVRHVPATTLGLLVDFMCFCVMNHAFRVKYFILRKYMLTKVMYVMRRPERWLACAGVRFIRTIVNTKDQFFLHQVTKNNLFEPIMSCFFQNGDRYNLLNSATLELVEYVLKENLKDVIQHLVQQYSHRFEEVEYVDTFVKLKQRYEQHMDETDDVVATRAEGAGGGSSGGGGGARSAGEGGPLRGRTFAYDSNGELVGPAGRPPPLKAVRRRWDDRGLSRDEEDYFDNDEEEGNSSATSGSAGVTPGAGTPTPAGGVEEDDLGPLLAPPEGPYPRPRRPLTAPDSPPSSPKRVRPFQYSQGPNAKRRAGMGTPTLTIATPIMLQHAQPHEVGLGGPHHHQRVEMVGGGPLPQAQQHSRQGECGADGVSGTPQAVWQGLTEYEDEEEQQQQQQQQQSGGGVAAAMEQPQHKASQQPTLGGGGPGAGVFGSVSNQTAGGGTVPTAPASGAAAGTAPAASSRAAAGEIVER